MFETSERYSDDILKRAVIEVDNFEADMGGTNFEDPLTKILKAEPLKGYPRQLFLLTDGQVSNTKDLVNMVSENSKSCRVHGIGIGHGASRALLKACADKGRGRAVFINDG